MDPEFRICKLYAISKSLARYVFAIAVTIGLSARVQYLRDSKSDISATVRIIRETIATGVAVESNITKTS